MKIMISKASVLAVIVLFVVSGVVPSIGSDVAISNVGADMKDIENYSSIQNEIESASEGDAIYMYGGIYHENIVVDKLVDLVDDCGWGSNSRGDTKFPVKNNPSAILDSYYASLKPTTRDTPDYFSWKDYKGQDWTTSIKDQLQDICGSCWAFGALGGLESTIKIWENNPDYDIDLSEQYLLSCSSGGCDGWYLSSTLSFIKHNGMITEECLPYQADDTIPCESKCSEWREYLIGLKDYKKIARGDITAIQEALMEYGPLPATMMVYDDFYPNYTGGVYKYTYGGLVFGHVVTIVGYDNTWGGKNEGY